MAIDERTQLDNLPEIEAPETPPMLNPQPIKDMDMDMDMPSGSEKEENERIHSASFELAVRANNFMSGNPTVFQHKNTMNPGQQQHQVFDQTHQQTMQEKSHRGEVRDPENDHRLKQNKGKEDDPSEHVETEREREARQRDEANDKRREDEEVKRQKEETVRQKIHEEQRKKVVKLQNTPFGQQPKNHFQPLSKGADAKLNEIIYHAAFGPSIRQAMGMTPTFHGLKKVRAMLKDMIAESHDDYIRNELLDLNSKVAILLIDAGVVDV